MNEQAADQGHNRGRPAGADGPTIGDRPNPYGLAPRPPGANRAEWFTFLCSLVTTITAIFGVYAFYDANGRERVKGAQEAVARIYPMDNEVNRYQSDNLGLRELLRSDGDGQRWRKLNDPALREKFFSLCSMNGNMFEYYLLIKENILSHPYGADIITAWDGYLEDVCVNSYAFRSYIRATRSDWTPMFLRKFDELTRDKPYANDILPLEGRTQTSSK